MKMSVGNRTFLESVHCEMCPVDNRIFLINHFIMTAGWQWVELILSQSIPTHTKFTNLPINQYTYLFEL